MRDDVPFDAHWRDSARPARFFIVDYRAMFPLVLALFHITQMTFIIAGVAVVFFCALERYGFTVTVFWRWLRSTIAGPLRVSRPWWMRERKEYRDPT